MFTYEFKPAAFKDLNKLQNKTQERIIKKLDYFLNSGQPLNFAEYLTDYRIGEYRFRIGNYRVVFDLEGERLIILAIGHRKDIYR